MQWTSHRCVSASRYPLVNDSTHCETGKPLTSRPATARASRQTSLMPNFRQAIHTRADVKRKKYLVTKNET